MTVAGSWRKWLSLEAGLLLFAVLYPLVPFVDLAADAADLSVHLDQRLVTIFIYGLLVVALNVQVGYAGLLQLGVAAFFGIGAMTTGVVTVDKYPFHFGFWGALLAAPAVAALAGLFIGAPTLRLRGDYLAIVTLGFGEVLRTVLVNLESITDGPRGLNPVAEVWVPGFVRELAGAGDDNEARLLVMYYVALLLLVAAVVLLHVLERTRIGRAFVALREDELAAACMGLDPGRIKLAAFAGGAALAGLAGALYATNLTTTADPTNYDFNNAIMVLCCLILGGLGSLRGALLGAALLIGFDNVLSPLLDKAIAALAGDAQHPLAKYSAWRWFVFGSALIAMMRYRPEGLFPARRVAQELHEPPAGSTAAVEPS
ncbi:MAG: branched-chain amino acid ABC transporter permease [Deltaproteobacteria bacterium]|nr:branched-chain amino acid ABC transporter permease [Deltaproteobacteria bacterium]